MKYKILVFLVTVVMIGGIWTACDKFDEPVKLVSNRTVLEGILDSVYVVNSIDIKQKQVLLEEFTGHTCSNCAGASIMAHTIAEEHNHHLIIYGVHSDYYAWPGPYPYDIDFTNKTGDELYAYFSKPSNPMATINRVEYGGELVHGKNDWENIVEQEIAKSNVVEMKMKNIYYPNLDTFQVDITTKFIQQLEGNFKLAVYLAEDSIVAAQKNSENDVGPTPVWLDFTHRNVLRDALTPTFGERFTDDGTIVQGEEYTTLFAHPVIECLNPEIKRLNVIAFIIEEESGEVLQVGELRMKME